MEFLFEQEVTGKTTRLVLKPEKELDQFALQMINHNEIACLAPLEAVWYNNANYLQYDITGLETLSSRLSGVLKKNEVLMLLGNMINGFEEADAYMLWENNLYLNPDYIFVNGEERCIFLYLPFALESGMDRISFLHQVTERILPNYEEKDPYLFHILNAFNRGAVKQLVDLKEILRKNNGNEPVEGMAAAEAGELRPEQKQAEQKQTEQKQPEQKQSEPKQPERKLSREEKKALNEKPQAAEAPKVSFAIPGMNGNFPVNIPEIKKEDKKKDDKKKEEKKKKDKKAAKQKPEAAEEVKKQHGIRLFGKKEKDPAPGAKFVVPDLPVRGEVRTNREEDMYESYAQTVMMTSPRQEEAAIDSDATICLGSQSLKAELIRERTKEHLQIAPEGTVLGSGSAAGCQISGNKAISRTHATIRMQEGAFYITDNNSSNGTWVNDNRLIPGNSKEIFNDTRIRLANEDFIFKIQ